MPISDDYHIYVSIDKREIKGQLDQLRSILIQIANVIEQVGGNANQFRVEALRLGQKKFRLDTNLERNLKQVAETIVDRVSERYLSFQLLEGREPDVSAQIQQFLTDKENNIEVFNDINVTELGIMNKDFLTSSTLTSSGIPYYQIESEKAGMLAKGFITEFSGASEEILSEDAELIKERIRDAVEKSLGDES